MEASYKRDMNHTYMILREEQPVDTAAYPVRMMLSNSWKAFLPCRIQGMDNQIFFYYDVTSRQSLDSLFGMKKMGYGQLKGLVEGLLAALEEAEEFLLDPLGILMNPAYIFWDSQEEAFLFCYFPGEPPEGEGYIRELTEYLLPRLDHRDREAVVLGYGIYRKAVEGEFYGRQLRELLYQESEKEEAGEENVSEEPLPEEEDRLAWWAWEDEEETSSGGGLGKWKFALKAAGFLAAGFLAAGLGVWFGWPVYGNAALAVGALAASACCAARGIKALREENGGEASGKASGKAKREQLPAGGGFAEQAVKAVKQEPAALEKSEGAKKEKAESSGGGSVTRLLCEEESTFPCLVPAGRRDLQPLRLEGELLLVGKLEGTVDLLVDVPTVSRLHARLEKREGKFYLQDLNSRNGTRVNQKELAGEEQRLLKDGDTVVFADVVYHYLEGGKEGI